jgi:hypothetical protein
MTRGSLKAGRRDVPEGPLDGGGGRRVSFRTVLTIIAVVVFAAAILAVGIL